MDDERGPRAARAPVQRLRRSLGLCATLATILLVGTVAASGQSKPDARRPATPRSEGPAPAQTSASAPKTAAGPDTACLGCHKDMAKERYVHGPVAAGTCSACHVPKPKVTHPSKPKNADGDFDAPAAGKELCARCHERKDVQPVIHGPVQWGQCGMCHDPHQSPNPFRLKEAPISKLCFTCHKDDKTHEKEVHGPVAAGACTACHDPHQGKKKYRLVAEGPTLCYTCHGEKRAEFGGKRFGHVPAKLDCSNCHDPHNSPNGARVQRPVPDLCFTCHPDKKRQIQTAKTDHEAVSMGKKCLNCHDPHFTDYPKQLKNTPMKLCFQCHDQQRKATDGTMLTNMKQLLEEQKDWHGPVRQQDCAACHDPHGTDNFRILRRPYPQEFYAPFKQEQYSLCFGCHEPTLVQEASTRTLTNFRNGDKNLHFVHVNRADKGRTCRACHEVHASHRPKHIREAVPFGGWEVKTNYVKYQSGGKCAPGCHAPRGYSRTQTVQNPIDYSGFTAD